MTADAKAKPAARDVDVWLRGNPRPAVAALAASLAASGLAGFAVAACRPPAWVSAAVTAACAAGVAATAAVAWAAGRPRLVRRGGVLEVRLSPASLDRLPLEVVECVFPGSLPLDGDGPHGRRVGTLVLRVAERAVGWRSRPGPRAWGTWEDGTVVVDGRWCEPLTQAVTRDIAARLLEARRGVAVGDPR